MAYFEAPVPDFEGELDFDPISGPIFFPVPSIKKSHECYEKT
jgi:hypothetical protein